MNPIIENILTRRSVRAFLDKEIPSEALEYILKAAQYAPSAMNRQTWQFTVVCSREKIQQLAAAASKELGREGYDMYQPQVIILVTNLRGYALGVDDCACALENIFLAAHSFGIGSVWINQLRDVCDKPAVRQILHDWGVPDDHVAYGTAALGYAAPAAPKEVSKTGKIVVVK